jgi:hypothetical protein
MFNRMLILCGVVVGIFVLFASSADGVVADGGQIHENDHHTLNHHIHRSMHVNNETQEISYLNETADLKSHEIVADIVEDTEEHPVPTISSIITQCLLQMSLSCAQKRFLMLLYQLDGKERIELSGNSVSIVRAGDVYSSLAKGSGFRERLNNIQDQAALGQLVEESIGRYLDSHAIRVSLPSWIRANVEGYAEATNVLDFGLVDIPPYEGKEGNIVIR